jgi:hypothetical protein
VRAGQLSPDPNHLTHGGQISARGSVEVVVFRWVGLWEGRRGAGALEVMWHHM